MNVIWEYPIVNVLQVHVMKDTVTESRGLDAQSTAKDVTKGLEPSKSTFMEASFLVSPYCPHAVF